MQTTAKILFALLAGCTAEANTAHESPALAQETIELEKAKLIIEHNATDEDTGFQGFVDGEEWKRLDIRDPDGHPLVSVDARGNLRELGLTELFFETQEPANDEVPIGEVLARLPAGDYEVLARTVDGLLARGSATLSHTIPAGPQITSPADGAEVEDDIDLVVAWEPVTESLCGADVTITHYQLIVERAEQPAHPGFGSETLSIHVSGSVTSMRVPHEFLQPGTDYKFEVLAIEEGGNQTISSGEFSTL